MKHLVVLTIIAVMGVPTLAAAAKLGAVCKEDRNKFCKDIKTTGGKPRDCLMQHKDELSDGCKALLDKPKKGKGEGKGKDKKAKDGAAAPAEGAAPAAPAEGAAPAAPAEGAAPTAPTESAPQAEPEVPGEK